MTSAVDWALKTNCLSIDQSICTFNLSFAIFDWVADVSQSLWRHANVMAVWNWVPQFQAEQKVQVALPEVTQCRGQSS